MISSHSVASLSCYGKINLAPVIQLNLIEVMITWKLWNKNPQAMPQPVRIYRKSGCLLPCSECLASYNNNSVVVSGKRVKKQHGFLLKNLGAYLLFCPCWSWSIRTEGSSLWLSVFKFLLHILYWSIISNPWFHFRNSTYLVCFERDKLNTKTLSNIFHNCKEYWAKTLHH